MYLSANHVYCCLCVCVCMCVCVLECNHVYCCLLEVCVIIYFNNWGVAWMCSSSTSYHLAIQPKNVIFLPPDATNNLLTVKVEDVSSPIDARFTCIFLSGFNGPPHCTVQYGTDPTYMNLPYSAESTETGTAGDTVSVVLRQRLNSSTEYYYTVSAVSGDFSVLVLGTFTTPEYSM